MVAKNTVDTLTNKSMSGSANTFTNLPASAFSAMTSAELATIVSDETGSGALVFATSPTLVTPVLGVATATSLTIGTQPTGTGYTAGVVATAGTEFTTCAYTAVRASDDTGATHYWGYKTRGTIASKSIIQSGDVILNFRALGWDGTADWRTAAEIRLNSGTGTPSATSMPGNIEFWTTPNSSTTSTLRLTIAQDGVGTWVNGVKFSGSGPTNTTLNHYAEVSSTVETASVNGDPAGAQYVTYATRKNYTANLVRVGTAVTCKLLGGLSTKNGTNGYISLPAIVPSGYRPVSNTVYTLITAKVNNVHGARLIWIGTDGEIRMYSDSALASIASGTANCGIDTGIILNWVTS